MEEILRFLKKQNRLTKVITIAIVATILVLYSLMGIIYRNYNVNKQISNLKKDIASLSEKNIEQQSKILYYSTDAYVEKALREKLGFQKEGERVYALPRTDPEREKLIREQQKFQENQDKKANIAKWFDFFFAKQDGEKEIEIS